jgi:hypothetical protein
MTNPDTHGPIDTFVIEFPAGASGAGTAQAITELLDRGTVRLYDLMVVSKDADGTCAEIDLATASDARLGAFRAFAGARSGLLTTDDVTSAGDVLHPGTMAVVAVIENTWAIPFVVAARAEGAEMVASARLTAQEIMDALDAVEASD